MKRKLMPPKNPNAFEGLGGAVYFNPNEGRSNELKRDRNAEEPFSLLSKVEKARRILALQPRQICDESNYAALCKEVDARNAEERQRAAAEDREPYVHEKRTLAEEVEARRERMLEVLELTDVELAEAKKPPEKAPPDAASAPAGKPATQSKVNK